MITEGAFLIKYLAGLAWEHLGVTIIAGSYGYSKHKNARKQADTIKEKKKLFTLNYSVSKFKEEVNLLLENVTDPSELNTITKPIMDLTKGALDVHATSRLYAEATNILEKEFGYSTSPLGGNSALFKKEHWESLMRDPEIDIITPDSCQEEPVLEAPPGQMIGCPSSFYGTIYERMFDGVFGKKSERQKSRWVEIMNDLQGSIDPRHRFELLSKFSNCNKRKLQSESEWFETKMEKDKNIGSSYLCNGRWSELNEELKNSNAKMQEIYAEFEEISRNITPQGFEDKKELPCFQLFGENPKEVVHMLKQRVSFYGEINEARLSKISHLEDLRETVGDRFSNNLLVALEDAVVRLYRFYAERIAARKRISESIEKLQHPNILDIETIGLSTPSDLVLGRIDSEVNSVIDKRKNKIIETFNEFLISQLHKDQSHSNNGDLPLRDLLNEDLLNLNEDLLKEDKNV